MNRLKELRKQHGYKSQKELADALFVNQTAVSQWERGVTTPSSQTLQRLSELYHVSIDYLLGRTEQKEAPIPDSEDGLSEPERHLVVLYRDLNNEGQEKLIDYADDLVSSGKYIKSDSPELGAQT